MRLSTQRTEVEGTGGSHEDDLAARIRRAGYRLTRQRLAVLAAVEASPTGLSAAELLAAARDRCAEVGLATVYRTLDILNAIGCTERVYVTSGGTAYVRCPSTQHHHVVCRTCGRVANFRGCVVEEMVPAVAAQTGFTIESHILELQGVCRECRERGVDADAKSARGGESAVHREHEPVGGRAWGPGQSAGGLGAAGRPGGACATW